MMEMNYRCTEASSALHDIHEAEIAQLRTTITEQQARIAQLEEALKVARRVFIEQQCEYMQNSMGVE